MMKYIFTPNIIPKDTKVKEYLKSINISSQVIKDLSKEFGLIKINGKSVRTIDTINSKEHIELTIKEDKTNTIVPIKYLLDIAYEDEYFLVVYKPYRVATIPTYANYTNSLANFVCEYMHSKQQDFIFRAINRLDKEAQGFVVIAKDKLIYSLLKNGNIQKFYTCLCHGKLDTQKITKSISSIKLQNGRNEIKRAISESGKQCETFIESVEYDKTKDLSKARIYISTGRTHQIRLHLSSINHPIVGDSIYGIEKDTPLQLYCNEIFIFHPILHKTVHINKCI